MWRYKVGLFIQKFSTIGGLLNKGKRIEWYKKRFVLPSMGGIIAADVKASFIVAFMGELHKSAVSNRDDQWCKTSQ